MASRWGTGRAGRLVVGVVVAAATLWTAGAVDGAAASPSVRGAGDSSSVARAGVANRIRPLTDGRGDRNPAFSDPYPVPVRGRSGPPLLAGTFTKYLSCDGALKPRCYQPHGIDVSLTKKLRTSIKRRGLVLESTKAHHPFQLRDGRWAIAFSIEVHRKSKPGSKHWNLILHGHPVGAANVAGVPTTWKGDRVLVGSLEKRQAANYNGKYVEDGSRLFLTYQKKLRTKGSKGLLRFGIVAQRMKTPATKADHGPRTLLEPGLNGRTLASENYFSTSDPGGFQLVETANITKVDGTYVMVYSVGAFNRPTYKIAVAYSDTFLPKRGSTYRKVTLVDKSGVWGKPGRREVDYLLQSQVRHWPHYARKAVQAPGVGSLVRTGTTWSLVFAGYGPHEKRHGTGRKSKFTASHRRPYYLPTNVGVPARAAVAAASPADLRSWIRP